MDAALLLARLALALVFLVAGVAKLRDQPGARQAIVDFGLPAPLARPLALLLPLGELVVAVAVVPTATAWWGALALLALLVAFSVGIGANLARGRRPACHCFGQVGAGPIGWQTLLRNAVLALAAGLVLALGPGASPLALVDGLGRLTGFEATLLVGGAVALGFLGFQAWFLLQLLAQNGRLLLRLEALEGRLAATDGHLPAPAPPPAGRPSAPRVGSAAPPFALPDLTGSLVSLDTLRAAGKPLLLVFADPGCTPCGALLPDIARWQRERADLAVVVVSRGSRAANQAKGAEHGLGLVLLQRDLEVAELYRAVGTPSAVLVRPDGTFGSEVAAGAERIRALVARYPRCRSTNGAGSLQTR